MERQIRRAPPRHTAGISCRDPVNGMGVEETVAACRRSTLANAVSGSALTRETASFRYPQPSLAQRIGETGDRAWRSE